MEKILNIVFILLASFCLYAETGIYRPPEVFKWYQNIDEAKKTAKEKCRPLLVFYYLEGDKDSEWYLKDGFEAQEVKPVLKNFIAVKINATKEKRIFNTYPMVLFYSPAGREMLMQRIAGRVDQWGISSSLNTVISRTTDISNSKFDKFVMLGRRQYRAGEKINIKCKVVERGYSTIKVADTKGNIIRTLFRGVKKAEDSLTIDWDQKDLKGSIVAPGDYVFIVEQASYKDMLEVSIYSDVPFVTSAEEKKFSPEDEIKRMRQFLDTPKNVSAYLHALRVLSDLGDKGIVPKVKARINELLEEIRLASEYDSMKRKSKTESDKNPPKEDEKEQVIDTVEELTGVLCDVKTDPADVKGLLSKLFKIRDVNPRLGRIALFAMGEIKVPGTFEDLLWVLQEESDDSRYMYRREFIWACSKSGVKEIEPYLFKLMPDETPSVRGIIALSFVTFKARSYGFQLLSAAKYEQNTWVKEKYEWAGNKLSN